MFNSIIRLDRDNRFQSIRPPYFAKCGEQLASRKALKYVLFWIFCLSLCCGFVGLCGAAERTDVSEEQAEKILENSAAKASSPTGNCESKCAKCDLDYWIVSTRSIGCYWNGFDENVGPGLTISHRVCTSNAISTSNPASNSENTSAAPSCEACEWRPAKLEEFLAAASDNRETWIMIHGNRTSSCEATNYGWEASQGVCNCGCNEKPRRVIIWSWPSDQIRGAKQDVRSKAERTNSESIYLSWFLRKMPRTTPVCLFGHSFGARISTGALHLLAGGNLIGYAMPAAFQIKAPAKDTANKDTVKTNDSAKDQELPKYRGIFTASAFDACWLLPGQVHGNATSAAEKLLFLNNSCDSILRLYPHIDKCTKPDAAGYCGVMVTAADQEKVQQLDACSCIGNGHEYSGYLRAANLLATMCRFAQFDIKP